MRKKIRTQINPEILVEATLLRMCNQNNDGASALHYALSDYTTQIQTINLDSLHGLKFFLGARVCDEMDLETRFLLRLISDATEAVLEQRPCVCLNVA